MADRLFVGVLGHRNAGKSRTWNELFGAEVHTGSRARWLELRPNEWVQVFLISGSNEERKKYAGDVLEGQDARIVLCSMQYVAEVNETIDYGLDKRFQMNVQWLNPGYYDDGPYPDYLGIGNRLLFSGATLSVRDAKGRLARRVRAIGEAIYGWAKFRRLIVSR